MSIWKKKNVFITSGLFFLIGVLSLTLLCVNNSKNYSGLDKVTLKANNVVNKDMFAIMVEKDDGSGYEESNTFPSEGVLNTELSGCIDSVGAKIDNALYYNNGVVNAEVDSTAYCYLYFDKVNMVCDRNTPFGSCLNTAKTSGFNSSMEGGLYRYQGAAGSVDNYVCFGTTDKSECLADTDAHMYRVIGVNSSGQVKLIKKEALNSTMQWYSDSSQDITWPNSTIYSNINGSSFYTNTTYVPSGWSSKIATTSWKYGDIDNVDKTAADLYAAENAWTTTTSAKIGLMYGHDYAYAYQSGGLNCSSEGAYSTCKTSWMFLRNNDSTSPSTFEWTMSYRGYNDIGQQYSSWLVDYPGRLSRAILDYDESVRPVFYLNSKVYYVFGSGTEDDPFIIDSADDIEAPTITVNKIDDYFTSARLSIHSNEESTYCVNTSSTIGDTSNCVLEGEISENSTIVSGVFSASNTYYVHVKDNAGNETISEALNIKVLYQKVEYIQSTGTQYINTGVSAPNGFKVFVKFNPTSTTPNYLVGAHNLSSPYGRNGFGISSSRWELGAGNTYPQSSTTVQINTDYEAEASTIKGDSYLKLNGSTVASSTDSNTRSSSNILIFQEHWSLNDASSSLNAKLYYMKLYDNTEQLVRDFIPVYRISDNVIGLFDKVNNVFYTNSGSGTFVKGSNVS